MIIIFTEKCSKLYQKHPFQKLTVDVCKKLICRSLSNAPLHYLMHKSGGGGGIWLFDPITKRTPWCGYSRANNFLDPVIRLAIIFPGFCHYFLWKEINVVDSQHSSSADQFISCWNAEMPYQDFNFLEGQLFPIHFQSDLFSFSILGLIKQTR